MRISLRGHLTTPILFVLFILHYSTSPTLGDAVMHTLEAGAFLLVAVIGQRAIMRNSDHSVFEYYGAWLLIAVAADLFTNRPFHSTPEALIGVAFVAIGIAHTKIRRYAAEHLQRAVRLF